MVEDSACEEWGRTFYRSDLLSTLPRRELPRVAGKLSGELGLPCASEKLALIEGSRDFTLLPWRPALDRLLGQPVSGIVSGDGVTWNFGRQRGGPEVG